MDIKFKMKQHPDSIYINESGLYTLLITSRTKKSKKFIALWAYMAMPIKWITNDVLPKLRKNNIFPSDKNITNLLKKINKLELKNKLLQNDLKIEKFPEGGMVYVVEYFDTDGTVYYSLKGVYAFVKAIKLEKQII
jgi:prophage antirepressor-like protein